MPTKQIQPPQHLVLTSALPFTMVLLSVLSSSMGAVLATSLLGTTGAIEIVGMRFFWAGLFLLVWWRSKLRLPVGWKAYRLIGLFAIVLAISNLTYYTALNLLPLGPVAAIRAMAPLTLAAFKSRKLSDIVWVLIAMVGVLLLTVLGVQFSSFNVVGVLVTLLATVLWACYIVLSTKVGQIFADGVGLALSSAIAALLFLPLVIYYAKPILFSPPVLLMGMAVGLLSTAIPSSLQMSAARHLPLRAYSIALNLAPAAAALCGFFFLQQYLGWQSILAIVLIMVPSIAGTIFQKDQETNRQKQADPDISCTVVPVWTDECTYTFWQQQQLADQKSTPTPLRPQPFTAQNAFTMTAPAALDISQHITTRLYDPEPLFFRSHTPPDPSYGKDVHQDQTSLWMWQPPAGTDYLPDILYTNNDAVPEDRYQPPNRHNRQFRTPPTR